MCHSEMGLYQASSMPNAGKVTGVFHLRQCNHMLVGMSRGLGWNASIVKTRVHQLHYDGIFQI